MRHPAVNGPAELAGLMPTLLGFTPHESVVVVGLDATSAIVTVLRVDVADVLADGVAPTLVRSVAAELTRHECPSTVALTYSGRGHEDMAQINARIRELSTPERPRDIEHLHVTGGTVAVVHADGTEMAPEAVASRGIISARLVEETVADVTPGEVYDVRYAASVAEKRTAASHARRWRARRDTMGEAQWRTASYALWAEGVTATGNGSPQPSVTSGTAGKLIAAMECRQVRDAILVSIMGHEALVEAILAGEKDTDVAGALADLLSPEAGVKPDVEGQTPAWRVLMFLDGHAVHDARAPMATIAAILRWWQGDTRGARAFLAIAAKADETYRLAVLLATTIDAGIEAGWIRRGGRRSATA